MSRYQMRTTPGECRRRERSRRRNRIRNEHKNRLVRNLWASVSTERLVSPHGPAHVDSPGSGG